MPAEVKNTLFSIIAEILEIDPTHIRPEHHFVADLGATSLEILQILIELDARLRVEVPDTVVEQARTVADILHYLSDVRHVEEELESAVGIASDHAGAALKNRLIDLFRMRGVQLVDYGPPLKMRVDYPLYASVLAKEIQNERLSRGILVCGTGIGMCIAANKFAGVRAAHVTNAYEARMCRQHNDANVLTLGSRTLGEAIALECIEIFLNTPFDPGEDERHARRIDQITSFDDQTGSSP